MEYTTLQINVPVGMEDRILEIVNANIVQIFREQKLDEAMVNVESSMEVELTTLKEETRATNVVSVDKVDLRSQM
jgi:hypothetical protein